MAIRTTTIWMLAAATALAACGGQEGGEQANAGDETAVAEADAGSGNETAAPADAAADKTIAETLAASADHSSLLAAAQAAGLETTLAGPGPYTLFAPTNAAFQALPAGTTETLMKPEEKGRLTAILTYHFVPGVVMVADLARAAEAAGGTAQLATLGGGNLKVTASNGAVVITDAKGGEARVSQGDIVQTNGIIHGIDAVLMPS